MSFDFENMRRSFALTLCFPVVAMLRNGILDSVRFQNKRRNFSTDEGPNPVIQAWSAHFSRNTQEIATVMEHITLDPLETLARGKVGLRRILYWHKVLN